MTRLSRVVLAIAQGSFRNTGAGECWLSTAEGERVGRTAPASELAYADHPTNEDLGGFEEGGALRERAGCRGAV
jgi:hypothetical protein